MYTRITNHLDGITSPFTRWRGGAKRRLRNSECNGLLCERIALAICKRSNML